MKSLKHINKYFYKYRVRLLLGIVFVSISNIFGIETIRFFGKTVDFLSKMYASETPIANASSTLLIYSAEIIGLAIVSGFFLFLTRQTIIVMSRLIECDLKNEIYSHYQQLDVAFYKRNNTGDLMNRISEDVSRVRMYIGPAIMYIVNTTITFGLTTYAMMKMDVELTLYVLVPLPILAISIYYVSNTINKKSMVVQEQLSTITSQAQEAFSGIRVLKAYGRELFSVTNFDKQSTYYKTLTMSLVKTEALFQPFMILLIGLSTLFIVYIGGSQVINGKITFGNVSEFILYVSKLTWPIASLGWVTSLIQRAAASQSRINEFLTTVPTIVNTNFVSEKIKSSIEFKNVNFTYSDSGINALKNVSFKVEEGESLAIIGRTGSGKSTIANLICRLYDATSGDIFIGNKNTKAHNLYDIRNQIGYVPQDVFLFSDSIANNIAFSIDVAKHDKSSIEQAAKDAAIYSNIIAFPKQFETLVGERGITLSGGQKQRISIARAIIKKPQLLIFDDCLSAIDTQTEEEILTNLKRVMSGKTSVIISHRVSSVKNATKIIVLNDGEIAEQGNHNELMTAKGIYYELFQMQQLEEQND